MTHGDKKAKGKSQASAKKSSQKAASKAETSKSGKTAGAESSKVPIKKQQAVPEKAAGTVKKGSSPGKEGAAAGEAKPKGRPVPDSDGFSNPVIANAFKRAVKKYPNAFRKLTD